MSKNKWTIRYVPSQMRADVGIEPPIKGVSGFALSMVGPDTFELLKELVDQANHPIIVSDGKPIDEGEYSALYDRVTDAIAREFQVPLRIIRGETDEVCLCPADGFNPMCPIHRPEGWSPR